MKRILIVDDHPIVRSGLKRILEDMRDVIVGGEASDAAEAIDRIRDEEWDLLVLDISLPGRSGLDLLRDVRRLRPALPILVLTMHSEEEFAVRAVRAGAAGYLTKDRAAEELVRAIEIILGGQKYVGRSLAERLIDEIQRQGERPPHELLSDREYSVLCLIAAGKAVKEIAAELSLSPSTISTYRGRILEKMNLKTDADITRYAIHNHLIV